MQVPTTTAGVPDAHERVRIDDGTARNTQHVRTQNHGQILSWTGLHFQRTRRGALTPEPVEGASYLRYMG